MTKIKTLQALILGTALIGILAAQNAKGTEETLTIETLGQEYLDHVTRPCITMTYTAAGSPPVGTGFLTQLEIQVQLGYAELVIAMFEPMKQWNKEERLQLYKEVFEINCPELRPQLIDAIKAAALREGVNEILRN